MSFAAAMLIAMALDALLGWPDALFLRIGHPVTWLGRLISTLDGALNRGPLRRLTGVLTALVVIGTAGGLGGLALALMPGGWVGTVLAGVLAWPLVAIRSMHDHVAAVARPLAAGDLAGARQAVSMIVGRDPSTLDSAGVARAATESLAENTSDGIVAPLFWGVVAGLPGIAAYKAINTLDSMIGHKSPRYLQFGWARRSSTGRRITGRGRWRRRIWTLRRARCAAGCTASGCAGFRWSAGPNAAARWPTATAIPCHGSMSPGAPGRGCWHRSSAWRGRIRPPGG